MTTYLLLFLLGLLTVHVYSRYNKAGRIINRIPGPTPLPFFGNLLHFNCSSEKIWSRILDLVDQYYPIIQLRSVMSTYVIIRHPDDLKILLTCKKNIDKSSSGYDNFNLCGNDGLLVSRGDKWRQRRKLLNPAFHPNILKIYSEIANEHAEELIANLKTQGKEIVLNLLPVFFQLTLGIVCEAAMGVNLNNFGSDCEQQYRCAFDTIGEVTYYRVTRPYIRDWMMKFLSIGRRQKRMVQIVRDFSDKIIQTRREYHERVGYQSFQDFTDGVDDIDHATETDSFKGSRKRLALLDLLLSAEIEGLIDSKGIHEEVDTFIATGYETAGVAISFTLLLLAENKKAQELARTEVLKILNESGGKITTLEVKKFDYLDRCVKEVLRLFPSGPFIGRSIVEEIRLKNFLIPAKTDAFISLFALHRDPNFWPEPNKFDPDRFLPENIQNRHSHAYLPFSAGPRSCIGQKFGMMEVKAVVAHILYNYYLEPVDLTANIKFEMYVTLKPSRSVHVKLIRIDSK